MTLLVFELREAEDIQTFVTFKIKSKHCCIELVYVFFIFYVRCYIVFLIYVAFGDVENFNKEIKLYCVCLG